MLVAFGAARSSPGTTTAVLAIAGCIDGAIVVEGDPDGGVLVARYGLEREPGLTSLAAAVRGPGAGVILLDHSQVLPGDVSAVVGPPAADTAVALWRSGAQPLVRALVDAAASSTVLVDLGRLTPSSPCGPLVPAVDLTVLVTRPHLEEIHAVGSRLDDLRATATRLVVLVVGDRPYGADSITQALGVEVLGTVADDRRAAEVLAGRSTALTPRSLRTSALARSARQIADRLVVEHGPRLRAVPEGAQP